MTKITYLRTPCEASANDTEREPLLILPWRVKLYVVH